MRLAPPLLRNLLRLMPLLFAAVLAPICAAGVNDPVDDVDRAFASGRFGEMAALLEPQIGALSQGRSEQLVRLCFAYSKIKSYKKLDACLDELENKIRAGDRSGGKYGSWWAKPTWFVTSRMPTDLMLGTKDWDIAPYPHIMRAEAAIDQGDYARALAEGALARSKLTSNRTQGNYFQIDVPGVMAIAHALSGQNEEARRYIDQLSRFDIASFATSSAEIYLRTTLARALFAVKDFKRALDVISRDETSGLRAMASAFAGLKGDDSLWRWEEVPRNYMRHKCEMEVGLRQEAKAGFDRLLAQPRIGDHGSLYWMLLYDRGAIAEQEGDADAALSLYARAIDAIELLRASINSEASRIGFVGDKQEVYFSLIRLLVARGDAARAFEYVERSKARALVDLLASKNDFAPGAADPGRVRDALAKLEQADADARLQTEDAAAQSAPRMRNLNLIRQELRQANAAMASLVAVTPVSADEFKSLIEPGGALVEYYYRGKDLFVFVLSREKVEAARLDAEGLDDAVLALRRDIASFLDNSWVAQSRKLYDLLWAPVEKSVKAGNVTVVAHGALHYLPFAALVAPDGKPLIEQTGLRFLPSASALKFIRVPAGKTEMRLLVLGNPDLGDPKWDLKYAESEAAAVAGLFGNSRLLLRKDASATNFLKSAARYSQVHFATHGSFDSEQPLNSGVMLAKDAENDGLLSAARLFSLDLDADLVTLSACETGLGLVSNGDDVIGLSRAFLYAGSRSIVASLWSVDDRATSALMQRFYSELKTSSKLDALRQAQIKTRQEFPHPFFWAAFQLTGRGN